MPQRISCFTVSMAIGHPAQILLTLPQTSHRIQKQFICRRHQCNCVCRFYGNVGSCQLGGLGGRRLEQQCGASVAATHCSSASNVGRTCSQWRCCGRFRPQLVGTGTASVICSLRCSAVQFEFFMVRYMANKSTYLSFEIFKNDFLICPNIPVSLERGFLVILMSYF